MQRFWLKFLVVIIAASTLIFIYASLHRPEIVSEAFRKKMTSPPAIFAALIFVVGICGSVWKKLKLVLESKGE